MATYARAVIRQWATLFHGQPANRPQVAQAWARAITRQDEAACPAMTVRGPAAATVLFLRHMGYSPAADSPWRWRHEGCPDADADLTLDGQEDLDDAVGNAVAWAGWIRAAEKRQDLGDPDTRAPCLCTGLAAPWQKPTPCPAERC